MTNGRPDPKRRAILTGFAAAPAILATGTASAQAGFTLADLRGSASAANLGLIPGAVDDQSRRLQAILDAASAADLPVFLPPGAYHVANLTLPPKVRLSGAAGASRLVFAGGGHFVIAEGATHIELSGIILDGANRPLDEYAAAALRLSNCERVVIENCTILGSSAIGLQVDRSSGRIDRCRISGASGECGLYALENKDFSITGNEVEACSNGGILVHRWQPGEDGTRVTGNRVFNIGAAKGGTGQWGNGINVFRAHSVSIQDNHVSDCALSAIRSNGGSNVRISGNTCLRSGETAIYSEFEFQGAIIANNLVDGAAIGISMANFMQGGRLAACTGNIVRNIHRNPPYDNDDQFYGIGISAEADTTLSGNVIEKAETCGINLGWGPYLRDVAVNGNVIRDCPVGVAVTVVEGAGPAAITGNVISGFGPGAIVGYRWMEAVTGDLAASGAKRFEHLAIEQNRIG